MSFPIKTVLISESVDPTCAKILEDNGIKVTTKVGLTKDQLIAELKNYDGLVVRSATKVTAEIIESTEQLKVIGRAGTGVDNIDCNAATRNGVLVINAPGGNTLSAAELTCAMIITLSRHLPQACISLKNGKWDRKTFMGQELLNKTLAIIGLGRIGREVAHRMQAFGMKTVGYDPLVPPEESIKFGVKSYDLNDLWAMADYITVHTPLIPQTKNLINDNIFAKCKKGVRIVNCARGGIIDENALLRALESGQCGGAGLDVYIEEPPKNTALIQHPKVICTPHLGASTVEAQNRVAVEIAEQFVDLLNGKNIMGVVNSTSFCQLLSPINKSWSELSLSLGKITSALIPSGSGDIKVMITTQGAQLENKVTFLSTAIIVGLLQQRIKTGVNSINAPVLAKEAGIEIQHKHEEVCLRRNIDSAIVINVSCGGKSHEVVGLIAGDKSFLSSLDGADFFPHLQLNGNLLLCKTDDSSELLPKLIGSFDSPRDIKSIWCSNAINKKVWHVFNTNSDCLNQKISSSVDFCAFVKL